MRNQFVGTLVIGMAIMIGVVTFLFNQALSSIVSTSCTHGASCPMWGTIEFQTNLSIGIMVFVVIIGLYLVFFGKEERIITKTRIKTVHASLEPPRITKEAYQKILAGLDPEERNILEKIISAEGTIFQSDLVDPTSLNKVKVTRILDKLEGRGLIERKRRGMTNVVILKQTPQQ